MYFDNLMHYDFMTRLYWFTVAFDFALLTLSSFNTLRNSMREKKTKIHSVETVSEVSQKSKVKIVKNKIEKRDRKVKRFLKKESS